MITAARRILDPSLRQDGIDDPTMYDSLNYAGGATAVAPRLRPQPVQTLPLPTDQQPSGQQERGAGVLSFADQIAAGPRSDPTPAVPTSLPTALPDGAGGIVPVPPHILAPTSPAIGGSPTATPSLSPMAPTDMTPWIPTGTPSLPATPGTPAAPTTPAPDPGMVYYNGRQVALDAAAPGTFTASDNAIDSVIAPGANDPSRIDLAKQYYDAFSDVENADYAHNRTDATNDAAAHGLLGSGQLTNRYGDLFSDLTLRKDAAKRSLITAATEDTIGDNRSNRDELRTERGYQQGLAQQAIVQRIQQAAAEAGLTQQEFENALREYSLGASSDPTAALLAGGSQANAAAGQSASTVGDLLMALALRNSRGG
jgi:hypothetical protein